ncbi:MAG: protein TolQ [Lysobacteraceae bacterium]|nr:MAG: protein TolQ [Xanthomonadaceae bacterium]
MRTHVWCGALATVLASLAGAVGAQDGAGVETLPALPPGPAGSGSLDLLTLVLHASLPVQAVMLLLVLGSIASWMIIFRKKSQLDGARREADRFEERFWSGADLSALFREAHRSDRAVSGLEAIFEAGFGEFTRLRQKRGMDVRTQLEGAQRAMRAQLSRELDALEHNLEFLANVGSISPYVGLFGTVWGIMISFQGLANVKEATIATVAPGISEALVATAMGLFAAIPAVWAYNRYATRVERLLSRYEAFAEEFSSILQRHSHGEDS